MIIIDDQGHDNVLDIEPGVRDRLNGVIRITGDGNRIRIGAFAHMPKVPNRNVINLTVSGRGNSFATERLGSVNSLGVHLSEECTVTIGEGTTFNAGCEILLHEPSRVQVGADCMIAGNVRLHTSDMHSVLDASTGMRLNDAADIVVGDHVWLATQVIVSKGVTIGSHAIVAQRALVTKDVPAGALVGGVPARVLKTNITWSRDLRTNRSREAAETAPS